MNQKKIFFILIVVLILFGIFARIISLNNDYTAEETEFTRSASAIKNTGHPIFYQSEQHPNKLGLWHPPMYIYLIAFMFLIAENEISARLINVIFSFLTTFLIYLFCKDLIGNKKGKTIGIISSIFFLINYYILSSSILIDIDMLSTFFIFLFIYSILKYTKSHKNIFLVISTISLFFAIWNRYPMAFLVFIGIGVYFLVNKDLRKDFKNYFIVGVISGICFFVTWFIYSSLIEPGTFFYFFSHNASLGSEQISNLSIYIPSFLLNISQFIRLFTFPATILIILSFFLLPKKSKIIKILSIYILVILIFFLFLPRPAFGYPRYFLTISPGISILIGILIYENLSPSKFTKKEVFLFIISFLISIIILLLLNPQLTIYNSKGLIQATNLPDFLFNILASVPILFVFFYKKSRRILIIILIALLLSYNLYFDIKFLTHKAHIKETGLYIYDNTDADSVVMLPNAMGHYTQRKFYNNDNNKPKLDFSVSYLNKYFTKSLQNREMNDNFFWPAGIYSGLYSPSVSEQDLEKVDYVVKYYEVNKDELQGFELEKIIGEFYIYHRS